jgi:predicted GH43/DUF377 family glycosyl hydrolase
LRRFLLAIIIIIATYQNAAGDSNTVTFDFEKPAFTEPGVLVKDHSLILLDGEFHLFYIRDEQKNFGHAVSTDLEHWTIMDPVLETGPGEWDIKHIWAPHVVPFSNFPGYLFMYYTGVNSHLAQRTCLALTMNPANWEKASHVIFTPFHGDTTWMHWNENGYSNYRDPCFFEIDGTYYLIQTALTNNGQGALALSESDDYLRWSDAGPLYVHNNSNVLESAFLLKRDEIFHLFFTESNVGGVSHMSSESLTGEWDIKTRRIIDSGHAAEITETDSGTHIISRHTAYTSPSDYELYSILFDTLSWNGNNPEVIPSEPFQNRWNIIWGTAFDHQPVFGNNFAYRGDDSTNVGFEGNWWIGTSESFCGPMTETIPGDYQGDEPIGEIRTFTFRVRGRSMRLLVGGGNYPDSCYVALCKAETDEIVYQETGRNSETMTERIWNLLPLRGKKVYLKIVDSCSCAFGHINVDGIQERMCYAEPPEDDGNYSLSPDKGLRKVRVGSNGRDCENGPEQHLNTNHKTKKHPSDQSSLSNYPNPFNPSTTINVISLPATSLEITIYSISGKPVRTLKLNTDNRGKAELIWNGRDNTNRELPAGIYMSRLTHRSKVLATHKLILIR